MTNLWEEYAKEYAEEYASEIRQEDTIAVAKKLFTINLSFEQVREAIDVALVSDERLQAIEEEVHGNMLPA